MNKEKLPIDFTFITKNSIDRTNPVYLSKVRKYDGITYVRAFYKLNASVVDFRRLIK